MKNIEFQFDVGDDRILASAGLFNGREEIYLNGRSISSRRNYKLKSVHRFEIDGKPFSISFLVTRIMFGQAKCQLLESGNVIKSYKVLVNYLTPKFFVFAAAMLISFFLFGVAKTNLGLSDYVDFLAYALIVVMSIFSMSLSDWSTIVEEEAPLS